MPYDLLLKGGTVVDPAQGLNASRDLAIANGTIAALAPSLLTSEARQVVDVAGAYVTRHGSKRLTCRLSICGGAILDPEVEGLPL